MTSQPAGLGGGSDTALEPIVLLAQSVLVAVARDLGGAFGLMDVEAGGIPLFHLHHGVVGRGQGFFGLNGSDPGVYGVRVFGEQLIEVFHVRTLGSHIARVNPRTADSRDIVGYPARGLHAGVDRPELAHAGFCFSAVGLLAGIVPAAGLALLVQLHHDAVRTGENSKPAEV